MNPSLQSPVSSLQSNSDVLVRVEGVSKKFCLSLKKSLWYGLQDMGRELTGRRRGGVDGRRQTVDGRLETRDGRLETAAESLQSTVRSPQSNSLGLRPKEFWAVNNVSFELKRGECLGLIGRNGAGKTTLLKMLNGLIKPDAGRIEMRGRVGALIALGAGFNPILTGRENIYVNGSVLGLSKKEIDAKLDEIIDFAEIGEFIDTPVQNYSSGMAVRLGFAVASSLNPDILLLDEVLAVGDTKFRAKCYNRIGRVLKRSAVIFVTHDMNQIGRICNQVMVLKRGELTFLGETSGGIEEYVQENKGDESESGNCQIWEPDLQIHAVRMEPPRIKSGDLVAAVVEYTAMHDRTIPYLRCNITNESRLLVGDYDSSIYGHQYELSKGSHSLRIPLGPLPLSRGRYLFNLAAFDESRKNTLFHVVDWPGLEAVSSMITTSVIELGHSLL